MSQRVLFLGSKPVGLRCLQALVASVGDALVGAVTIDDRADSRSAFHEIEAFCAAGRVALTVARARADVAAVIRDQHPTLCFVCGWYWLVDDLLLEAVPRGFIGLHFSALPKYRGGSPLVWQIINDESEIGVSMFSLTKGIDEGAIWAQRRVPLHPDDYVCDVLERLEDVAVSLLHDTLPGIISKEIRPVPQDPAQATYVSPRGPDDGEIHWNAPARVIFNFIRAQSRPYPGAFTHLGDARITVWRAHPGDTTTVGEPGEIVRVTPEGVWVACGDGQPLIVEQVGLHGRDRPAHEVMSFGLRLAGGARPR